MNIEDYKIIFEANKNRKRLKIMNKEYLQLLLKNLHHVFVPIGILFGFLIFAFAAIVDPLAGILAYLFFYLPAFFGGIYSGQARADDSDFLDVLTEGANNMFKLDIDDETLNIATNLPLNQISAITITLFYFAFWLILGLALGIPVVSHYFKWILPSYLIGLLSNKDIMTPVISFIQKNIQKLKKVL